MRPRPSEEGLCPRCDLILLAKPMRRAADGVAGSSLRTSLIRGMVSSSDAREKCISVPGHLHGESSMSIQLTVNGVARDLDVAPDMPLLWAIRDHLQLTGTKFGCGMALCGACTVHID